MFKQNIYFDVSKLSGMVSSYVVFHDLSFPNVWKPPSPRPVFPGPMYPVDWTLDSATPLPEAGSLHNILSLGSGCPLVITKQIIRLVMIEARKQYPINYRHEGQQQSAQSNF